MSDKYVQLAELLGEHIFVTPTKFEPELGQELGWGSKGYFELDTPDYIDTALEMLAEYMETRTKNNIQTTAEELLRSHAFRNMGQYFKNDTFEVESYNWDEDIIQPYNFKYKDIEVRWYKYLGRGMSINRKVSIEECWQMLKDCVESLHDSTME